MGKLNKQRGAGSVHLWGENKDFAVFVQPDDAPGHTRVYSAPDYAHARRQALADYGPNVTVPNAEFRG